MKRKIILYCFILFTFVMPSFPQEEGDTIDLSEEIRLAGQIPDEAKQEEGFYYQLKTKFIEGNPYFMSVISACLIFGLAICIERTFYLNLADVNSKKLIKKIEDALEKGDVESAKDIARNTRGPVASIIYQGLMRIDQDIDIIEKSIVSYGSVQTGLLEKNFSWITLFIAMAPSLGFLGTVLGMVQAFDDIQMASSISPAIVAAGMKVALITTVGGLIVAVILQLFYNYLLTKDENIIHKMEDSSITLLDLIIQYKAKYEHRASV